MQNFQDSFDGKFEDNLKNSSKQQNSLKSNKIVVNVADTQYAVVKHIAKKYKWCLSIEPIFGLNFDLCWSDNHLKPELFARMGQHQKINHMPGMSVLSRKNSLGRNLMLFRKKFQLEYDFFPITWSLPNDFPQLSEYHENRQQGKAQTFIVKPEASCQGKGIFLTRNLEKIKYDKCVVQRYLHKPYLINDLKFDLRIYVLITGIEPLRIFVFQEGLARFATETYRPPRTENLQNKFMHLTNYAINKESPNFIFNESINDMSIGHKRSLSSVYSHIASEGHNVEQLKERINDIFIKTIITGYPALSRSFLSIHPDNFANDMCFQILGFDIMLDHKLNPFLLEVNYTPSFTADSPLDRYIKKRLIQDTLTLVGVNEKWKSQQRRRRQKEIQERMVSGKRKKYSIEERKYYLQEFMRKRNEHEEKVLGSDSGNGYRKIFVLDQGQFQQYRAFYDFAEQIHSTLGSAAGCFSAYNASSYLPNNGNKCETLYKSYFQTLPDATTVKGPSKIAGNKSVVMSTKANSKKSTTNSGKVSSSGDAEETTKNRRVSSANSKNYNVNSQKSRKLKHHDISSSKCIARREADKISHVSRASSTQHMNFEYCVGSESSIFTNEGLQSVLLNKTKSDKYGAYEENEKYLANIHFN